MSLLTRSLCLLLLVKRKAAAVTAFRQQLLCLPLIPQAFLRVLLLKFCGFVLRPKIHFSLISVCVVGGLALISFGESRCLHGHV